MLKINMEYRKGILFVRLKGILNKISASSFNSYINPILINYGIKYIVFNLKDINILDDVGKSALRYQINTVKKNKGIGYLVNSKLIKDFNVIESELTALKLINV